VAVVVVEAAVAATLAAAGWHAAVAVVPWGFEAGVECPDLGPVRWAAAVLQTGWAVGAAFLVAEWARAAPVGAVIIVPAHGTAATSLAATSMAGISMAATWLAAISMAAI
jgi:hypothetical protein